MRSRHGGGAGGGFTLVELLVVVAVVGVLVALMVPLVGYVREKSRRAVCQANMRSLGVMYRLYASENQDAALVGYQSGVKQLAYFLHNNDQSSGGWKSYWGQLGPLYLSGMITTPRAFYCPSETDTRYQFNQRGSVPKVTDNPWPPVIELSAPVRQNTRLAYSIRPVHGILWPEPAGVGVATGVAFPAAKLPRLTTMGQTMVIFADLIYNPAYLDGRHRDGVNVLRVDGSGQWVARGQFNGHMKQIGNGGASSGYNDLILNDSSPDSTQWTGVWADMDRD